MNPNPIQSLMKVMYSIEQNTGRDSWKQRYNTSVYLKRYDYNIIRDICNRPVSREGVIIKSSEGYTEGDNIATGGCALSTKPLTDHLRNKIKQVWFADDSAARV